MATVPTRAQNISPVRCVRERQPKLRIGPSRVDRGRRATCHKGSHVASRDSAPRHPAATCPPSMPVRALLPFLPFLPPPPPPTECAARICSARETCIVSLSGCRRLPLPRPLVRLHSRRIPFSLLLPATSFSISFHRSRRLCALPSCSLRAPPRRFLPPLPIRLPGPPFPCANVSVGETS